MRWSHLVWAAVLGFSCAGCRAFQDPVLRNAPLIFTEIHFAPSAEQGGATAEFIEVANRSESAVDASGWSIAGIGECTFRPGLRIEPGQAVVVCKVEEAIEKLAGGPVVVAATFTGKLKNEGETLTLLDPSGRIADQVAYDPANAVVASAIDTGKSLQRPKGARNWTAAPASPGRW